MSELDARIARLQIFTRAISDHVAALVDELNEATQLLNELETKVTLIEEIFVETEADRMLAAREYNSREPKYKRRKVRVRGVAPVGELDTYDPWGSDPRDAEYKCGTPCGGCGAECHHTCSCPTVDDENDPAEEMAEMRREEKRFSRASSRH